jgi:hypothetical protein
MSTTDEHLCLRHLDEGGGCILGLEGVVALLAVDPKKPHPPFSVMPVWLL